MSEAKRMTHLVANLRPAEHADRDDFRRGKEINVVKVVDGIVFEQDPVRLAGVRSEMNVRGQFPLAQTVKSFVGIRCWKKRS